ncbi:Rgg/GadR/MutR family transcriptional regulator [Lacticaseibacillus kribbianus]|uniref:Rgg/GadR/MutR family transcriptional regulator n=1 Tax=Lacticaseibacillus kribbianus TaxID=2926292 RepID=UPI001CD810D8|nr:Rgg/GadR/MutR family transcriptional regulator [Lacticaseibacillus kribbianus]
MTTGALYRQMRQSRGITLQDIELETGLTASFVSRFERGRTDVSQTNFGKLLTAINVAQAEFAFEAARAGMPPALTGDAAQLWLAKRELPFLQPFLAQGTYGTANLAEIRRARDAAEATFRAAPTRNHHFAYLFYRGMVAASAATTITADPDAARPVIRYLQQVDSWGVYEVQLFQLFMVMMPTADNLRLLTTGVKLSRRLKANARYRTLPFDLLVGDFTVFLARREFDAAAAVLGLLRKEPNFGGTALVRRFLAGWLAIRQGDVAGGTATCRAAIALMAAIELPQDAAMWQSRLDEILGPNQRDMVLINLGGSQ